MTVEFIVFNVVHNWVDASNEIVTSFEISEVGVNEEELHEFPDENRTVALLV